MSALDALTAAVASELHVVAAVDPTDDDFTESEALGWTSSDRRATPAGRIHLRSTGRTGDLESIAYSLDALYYRCQRLDREAAARKSRKSRK